LDSGLRRIGIRDPIDLQALTIHMQPMVNRDVKFRKVNPTLESSREGLYDSRTQDGFSTRDRESDTDDNSD
jgi:hypothetical protein